MKRALLIVATLLIMTSLLNAAVISEWRGENRDGVYSNENLMAGWPDGGPKMLWSVEGLGDGFSSASVTDDRVYVTGLVDDKGVIFAFDLRGKQLWRSSYGPDHHESYPGARTTPTVTSDGKLYVLSGAGNIVCMNTANGKILWQLNIIEKFGGENLRWGITESPLVNGDVVYVTPGAKTMMAALNRHDGSTIWTTSGNGQISAYSSPTYINHNGRELILQMMQTSVVAIDPKDGKLVWSHPHKTDWDVNPNTPTYHDGHVLSYSGYGTGGQLLKLSADGSSVSQVWSNKIIDSQIGAAVLVDGTIYASGHKNRGWHAVDWQTGKTTYSDRAFRKGPIIAADGKLIVYSEGGECALVNPDPNKFDIISQFEITMGSNQHWAHPVVKDGRLYVRHGDVLMVYDIAAK